jgi:hypothetical protein
MSALNGNRARFRINQVRKLHRRQRIQALVASLKGHTTADAGVGKTRSAPDRAPAEAASGAAAVPLRTVQ